MMPPYEDFAVIVQYQDSIISIFEFHITTAAWSGLKALNLETGVSPA